jgi:uncharacterized protein YktA (UPF0223 family)
MAERSNAIPLLSANKPYLGTPAYAHADYISAANEASAAVDMVYSQMVGSEKDPRSGKAMKVRDIHELRVIEERLRTAKEAIKKVLEIYPQKVWSDADDIINRAKDKFTGIVQAKYKEIKKELGEMYQWDTDLGPYRKMQAVKSEKEGNVEAESGLKAVTNQEGSLFDI